MIAYKTIEFTLGSEFCHPMKTTSIYVEITPLSLLTFVLKAQNISGNLSLLANQSIKLEGFKGLKTYPISSSIIDEKGNFKLTYANTDFGVGYSMQFRKMIYVWLI